MMNTCFGVVRTIGDSFGGVTSLRLDVAIEFAPVSPRGSAPRLEARLRLAGLDVELRLHPFAVGGTVSVCAEEAMLCLVKERQAVGADYTKDSRILCQRSIAEVYACICMCYLVSLSHRAGNLGFG